MNVVYEWVQFAAAATAAVFAIRVAWRNRDDRHLPPIGCARRQRSHVRRVPCRPYDRETV